jgi:hypothetical protein
MTLKTDFLHNIINFVLKIKEIFSASSSAIAAEVMV